MATNGHGCSNWSWSTSCRTTSSSTRCARRLATSHAKKFAACRGAPALRPGSLPMHASIGPHRTSHVPSMLVGAFPASQPACPSACLRGSSGRILRAQGGPGAGADRPPVTVDHPARMPLHLGRQPAVIAPIRAPRPPSRCLCSTSNPYKSAPGSWPSPPPAARSRLPTCHHPRLARSARILRCRRVLSSFRPRAQVDAFAPFVLLRSAPSARTVSTDHAAGCRFLCVCCVVLSYASKKIPFSRFPLTPLCYGTRRRPFQSQVCGHSLPHRAAYPRGSARQATHDASSAVQAATSTAQAAS